LPERKTAQTGTGTGEERKPLKITRDVRIAIAGCYSNARKQGNDADAAIRETCEALSSETQYLAESEVRLQLKIWTAKHGSLESALGSAGKQKLGSQERLERELDILQSPAKRPADSS
jgi:hypothetical protein